jgi:hypothetical protein
MDQDEVQAMKMPKTRVVFIAMFVVSLLMIDFLKDGWIYLMEQNARIRAELKRMHHNNDGD